MKISELCEQIANETYSPPQKVYDKLFPKNYIVDFGDKKIGINANDFDDAANKAIDKLIHNIKHNKIVIICENGVRKELYINQIEITYK